MSNPSQWYSKLKRICSFDQNKYEPIICDEIQNLSDQEQAERIAEFFAAPRQEYDALRSCDILVEEIDEQDFPHFSQSKVAEKLKEINTKKSVPDGDIPPKMLKEFSKEIANPLADIINSSIKQGIWPSKWKSELVTPIAKVVPTKLLKNLRSISGLVSFNKIQEKLIADLIISDMKSKMDPSQYGNQQGISTQHYLVNMINKILSDTDTTEVTAVLATFVDWKDAFPNQCPKLGVEAFQKCGVRNSLIPILINYLQDRSITIKWHGKKSQPQATPGGGPQGGHLGNLEYLAQSNQSSDCVKDDSRY